MNTPAHIIINLLCLGKLDQSQILTPVVIGAVLPDAPMFVFYFVEKVILGKSERVIWTQSYYQENWQNFIDLFNSLPLILIVFLLCFWWKSQIGQLLCASMTLHILGDLPLHNDDAHRHFFPLSSWRFHSPVSYWDPQHYGNIVTVLEILAVIVSCVILLNSYQSWGGKICIGAVGASYLLYFIYVFTVWV